MAYMESFGPAEHNNKQDTMTSDNEDKIVDSDIESPLSFAKSAKLNSALDNGVKVSESAKKVGKMTINFIPILFSILAVIVIYRLFVGVNNAVNQVNHSLSDAANNISYTVEHPVQVVGNGIKNAAQSFWDWVTPW